MTVALLKRHREKCLSKLNGSFTNLFQNFKEVPNYMSYKELKKKDFFKSLENY